MKTEREIIAILNKEIRSSTGFIGGEIVNRRKKSLEYYLGKPFGNEVEGRSQVVSTDVSDTVESLLPSLMRIFTAGDNVFHCEPVGVEDSETARQCSDYLNYIFYKENTGFTSLYTAFKDALIQRNGILKIYWDNSQKTTREEYKRLTTDEHNLLINDKELEIVEHSEYEESLLDDNNNEIDKITYHDIVVKKTVSFGQVRIEPVPPEEFLIERQAKSIDSANFVCHRTNMTRTALIEMGFDKDEINKLPTGNSIDYLEDNQVRFQEDLVGLNDDGDKSSDEILIHECYTRIDINDDGKSELVKILLAGDGTYKALSIEEVDSMPFISITPVIMPHRFYGRSVSELVEDIQLIKSTVMRQMLDNMYLTNNNRIAVQDGQVSLDDLLTNRPGGIVRTKQPPSNVMMAMQTQPISDQAANLLGYLDAVKEARTGITRQSQGLDPNTLNKTATGINQILSQSQMRMELIARIFAETGIKDLGYKMFELICKYQQKEKILKIRGKFIPMRPFEWRDKVNVTVAVGLGTGSKEQQLILLTSILERQLQAINLQQNVYGPMVNLRNVYNTLKKLIENAGLGNVEPYFMDPDVGQSQMPQLPPKPPTEFEKVSLAQVQGQNEREVIKTNVEMKRIEAEMRAKLLDYEIKIKELELKYSTKINEIDLKNRSMIETQKLQQTGDIFKKIMEGQKEFFNDGQQTNSTTQPGPTDSQGETS
jgi:hypothetical protein